MNKIYVDLTALSLQFLKRKYVLVNSKMAFNYNLIPSDNKHGYTYKNYLNLYQNSFIFMVC